jgi:hypothetical protein
LIDNRLKVKSSSVIQERPAPFSPFKRKYNCCATLFFEVRELL